MIRPVRRINTPTANASVNDDLLLVTPGESGTVITGCKPMAGFGFETNSVVTEIKDVSGTASGSKKITWAPASGQTLEPGSSFEITAAYDSMRVLLDGTVWRRL